MANKMLTEKEAWTLIAKRWVLPMQECGSNTEQLSTQYGLCNCIDKLRDSHRWNSVLGHFRTTPAISRETYLKMHNRIDEQLPKNKWWLAREGGAREARAMLALFFAETCDD